MKGPVTLAIATAGPVAAAVVSDDLECAAASESLALAGTMKCVLAALGGASLSLDDVDLVAVCRGPGSFTGLRIGVAFAKSLAQGRSLPLVGVATYDVADYGAPQDVFPRAAVVAGKRDYFYASIVDGSDVAPRFLRGAADEIAAGLGTARAYALSDVDPMEQAVRVGRIARAAALAGHAGDWRSVDIEYGQRPNAETNWEVRHGTRQRGGPRNASNLRPR